MGFLSTLGTRLADEIADRIFPLPPSPLQELARTLLPVVLQSYVSRYLDGSAELRRELEELREKSAMHAASAAAPPPPRTTEPRIMSFDISELFRNLEPTPAPSSATSASSGAPTEHVEALAAALAQLAAAMKAAEKVATSPANGRPEPTLDEVLAAAKQVTSQPAS